VTPSGPAHGPRVVLVGAMGAGKTTVGRLLADRWGVPVRDTDLDVAATAGKEVSDIFVDEGEQRFRQLERAAVVAALADHSGVLALGGGAVLDERTRADLCTRCVVFLQVGLAEAVKRVGLGVGRPLLLGNVRSRVKSLLDERAPLYAEVATITVVTDGRPAAEVAAEVARLVEAREQAVPEVGHAGGPR
jgi:shikimate kinase